MSAIVKYEPGELPSLMSLAKALITGGGFLPPHIKQEGELLAVILAGKELGIPPMASIRGIRLIKGQVALDAALQLGLIIRAGCKFRWLEDGSNGTSAALELSRDGQEPFISRFTLADAQRAGLVKDGGNWKSYPPAMLRARCVSAAGKAYAPDVMAGIYLPEELDVIEQPTITVEQKQEEQAGAQFVAQLQEQVGTVEQLLEELPLCQVIEDFADLAGRMLRVHGKLRRSPPWLAFADACASHEVSPREAVELATRGIAEAAQ